MLFSSFIFIFAFLPLMFVVFHILKYFSFYKSAKISLVLGSLFFYSFWKLSYLPILLSSIIINYFLALMITRYGGGESHILESNLDSKSNTLSKSLVSTSIHFISNSKLMPFKLTLSLTPKAFLILGIIFNLALLGFFKYTDFFLSNVNTIFNIINLDFNITLPHIMLPLAISFFTFQQIAFLVDCYKQRKDSTKSLETKTESTLNIKNTNLNEVLECKDSIIKHKKESNLILDSKDSQSLNINTIIESKTFNYNASINPNIPNNQAKVIKYSAPLDFLDYCLFVCFFPQLIAGPIVHHKEMMPQFNNLQNKRKDKKLNLDSKVNAEIKKENESLEAKLNKSNVDSKLDSTLNIESNSINLINHNKQYLDSKVESNSIPNQINQNKTSFLDYKLIAKGLFIFSIGLFKKVFIADSFAKWANKGFEAVENGIVLNVVESWATSLSYTYQLYFDFSGYCDMAIGLGLLFGIVLPINFYSPYKALNITIFWRKWHITLGRFLKDYIYIPLGGNKNSINKIKNNILTLRNLFLVAFISGIWHGAGWGFIIWGTMHGIAMVIHRAYRFIIDYFLQKEENRKKEDNKYLKTIMECKSNLDSKVELESTNNINIQSLDSKSNLALDSNHNKFNSFHRFTRFSLKSFLDSTFYKVICFIITFNFINIAWIFFRSENVSGAINLLRGMFGVEWVDLPLKWWRMPETLKTIEGRNETIIYIILAFVVCLWIRNSWEMARAFSGRVWEVVLFAVFIQISFSCMQDATIQEFIYFNF